MAVSRLREERCFVAFEASLGASAETLSTIGGAMKYGRLVSPEEMGSVDLVISGSVAVNREGIRIGKGGGFADLEYAMAVSVGVVNDETPVLTTVHDLQILDKPLPSTRHDVSLDYIVTEHETIDCNRQIPRPNGIYWDDLEASKIQEIPLLMRLKRELNNRSG
jgi:5-formyltetrahydrofolate cyclo-ligase